MAASDSSINVNTAIALLKRRWIPALAVFVGVTTLGMIGAYLKKPVYVAEGKLKFERLSQTSSLIGVAKDVGRLEPLISKSSPLTTEAEVIRSYPVVHQTITQMQLKDPATHKLLRYDQFLHYAVVAEVKGSDILKVSYQNKDPELASRVVNTLIAIYLKQNLMSRRAQAVAAREFIEQELPKAEKKVRQAEVKLRQFKEANNVVMLKEETGAAVSRLNNSKQGISSLRSQISDLDAQIEVLQNKLGIEPGRAIEMTVLSQASGTQEALKQLQQVENQLALERSRYRDNHPTISNLETKRANLQGLLQTRIDQLPGRPVASSSASLQMGAMQQELTKNIMELSSRRQGLVNQLGSLLMTQAEDQRDSSQLPRLEKEQRELERQLEAFQSTYLQLLQKDGEARVAENQNIGNAQIVAQAQLPEKPISPMTNYLAAFLLGLLSSGGVVYGLEMKDKTIKTIEQTRQLLGYPLLGVVPDYSSSKGIDFTQFGAASVIQANLVSAVGAAYRMMQANLKFLSSDKPLKTIVMTSSVPKEGKSTVSAHLAATIAESGRRVLLVDGDMHHPRQHLIWELPNEIGLSHMLVDQISASQAIQSVAPNLEVLTSGALPPNAPALLNSQRMVTLLDRLAASYDFIVIDAPPVNVAADAQILGKMADGVVLVVRPGGTEVGNVRFAKERLEQSGQNVLGIVVNGCIAKNEPDQHYFMNQDYATYHAPVNAG